MYFPRFCNPLHALDEPTQRLKAPILASMLEFLYESSWSKHITATHPHLFLSESGKPIFPRHGLSFAITCVSLSFLSSPRMIYNVHILDYMGA